jgi:hypothetical protein
MDGTVVCEKGNENVFNATFVTTSGEAATLTAVPKFYLYHYKGGNVITDVDGEEMSLLEGSTYIYKFLFRNNVDEGNYVAKYIGLYDTGETVVGEQSVRVVGKGFYEGATKITGGAVKTIVRDTWSKKEKDALVTEFGKVINTIADLDSRTTKTREVAQKINETLAKVGGHISESIKQLPQYDDSEVKTELLVLKEIGDGHQKTVDLLSKELIELKENYASLMPILLKLLPEDKLDEVLHEVNKDDRSKA